MIDNYNQYRIDMNNFFNDWVTCIGNFTIMNDVLYYLKSTVSKYFVGEPDWKYLDSDQIFLDIVSEIELCCSDDEAMYILAIFCFDNGLYNCQLNMIDKIPEEFMLLDIHNIWKLKT